MTSPTLDEITIAKTHPLWPHFVDWAEQNGIDGDDHPDDWYPSWECFFAGACAYARATP